MGVARRILPLPSHGSHSRFPPWEFYNEQDYWIRVLCPIDVTLRWMVHFLGVQLRPYDMVPSCRLRSIRVALLISDEEEVHPQALAAIATPSMSTPTSSDSTSDWASTSDTSEHAGHDDYTSVIHLFRPALQGRPTHIHALTPPGTRSWRTSVFSAWPRLRYDPWQFVDVHRSLYDDYPQQDDVTFRVVIAQPDLPSPLHVVPLVVIHWRDFSFFRAITLPRLATTGHVLAAFGLVPFCGVEQEHCPMFHNGYLQWSVTERQAVDHGDYIRVAPRMVPTDGFAEHVAQLFNHDHNPGGFYSPGALSCTTSLRHHRPLLDCDELADVYWHLPLVAISVLQGKISATLCSSGCFTALSASKDITKTWSGMGLYVFAGPTFITALPW